MTRLGPSLAELLGYCNGRFSLKTSLLLFDQMLSLVQRLHENDFVHSNLKPNHFIIGTGDETDVVYLIDFDNASNLKEKSEVAFSSDGYWDFASTNRLSKGKPCWKDDIESLVYILIFFLDHLIL